MEVSQLYIYPIKSLGGIAVTEVNITDRGFEYDRRWMLVDGSNRFLSQRESAVMALLQVEIFEAGLRVFHKQQPANAIFIPLGGYKTEQATVYIWDDSCLGTFVSDEADEWFSSVLNIPCRLVYMRDEAHILINEQNNINQSLTSFSDGYPILLLSEASLNDLNNRLEQPLPINRFRPNLVIKETGAYEEGRFKEIIINGISFYVVSSCGRCVVTTIDQSTAVKNKEPLRTLATYRSKDNKIYFGENVIAGGTGKIEVGNGVRVVERKKGLFL